MKPPVHQRAASLDDPDDRHALSVAVGDWEPQLELEIPRRDAALYEPDGTLYAVCLAESLALRIDRRTVTIHKGDAVVLPRAFGVDADPTVDLLALRHLGPPPDHFRERFLQIWGFEHLPAPPAKPGSPGRAEVIALADPRHRVPYAVVDIAGSAPWEPSSDLELLVVLDGQIVLEMRGPLRITLNPRDVVAARPGTILGVDGQGRVGVLTVLNDLAHAARRTETGSAVEKPLSPEYQPPTNL